MFTALLALIFVGLVISYAFKSNKQTDTDAFVAGQTRWTMQDLKEVNRIVKSNAPIAPVNPDAIPLPAASTSLSFHSFPKRSAADCIDKDADINA